MNFTIHLDLQLTTEDVETCYANFFGVITTMRQDLPLYPIYHGIYTRLRELVDQEWAAEFEADFRKVAEQHKDNWNTVAMQYADRLLHTPPDEKEAPGKV